MKQDHANMPGMRKEGAKPKTSKPLATPPQADKSKQPGKSDASRKSKSPATLKKL